MLLYVNKCIIILIMHLSENFQNFRMARREKKERPEGRPNVESVESLGVLDEKQGIECFTLFLSKIVRT
jgi:hypothetical protein